MIIVSILLVVLCLLVCSEEFAYPGPTRGKRETDQPLIFRPAASRPLVEAGPSTPQDIRFAESNPRD